MTRFTPAHGGAGNSRCFSFRAAQRALTEIDYDTYAEGEARLGWVNMTLSSTGDAVEHE